MKRAWNWICTHAPPNWLWCVLGLAELAAAFRYGDHVTVIAAISGTLMFIIAGFDWLADVFVKRHMTKFSPSVRRGVLLERIDELRAEEGSAVTLLCPNPDFDGPAQIIEVTAAWTDWEASRIPGETLEDAVMTALARKSLWEAQQPGFNSNKKETLQDDE